MITNLDDFTGLLQANKDSLEAYYTAIITQKEPMLLKRWFGYAVAKELQVATPTTEYAFLLDGGEYTDADGILQELTGLKKALPHIMYFYCVREQQTQNASIGQVEALAENSKPSNPTPKLTKNYNQGVEYINEVFDYMTEYDYNDDYIRRKLTTLNQFGI